MSLGSECAQAFQTFNDTPFSEEGREALDRVCQIDCGGKLASWYRNNCNDDESADELETTCSSNGQIRCFYTTIDQYQLFGFVSVPELLEFCSSCDTCRVRCDSFLELAVSDIGCCLNTVYVGDSGGTNMSGNGSEVTMNTLERCGVDDPGFCSNPFGK